MRFLWAIVALALLGQPAGEPPRLLGTVYYNGPGVAQPDPLTAAIPSEPLRDDLRAIRTAGYNGVTTWIAWRDGEPRRGVLEMSQVDRFVTLAAEAALFVEVEVYAEPQPAWKKDGTNALAGAFYERVRDRYAGRGAAVRVRPAAGRDLKPLRFGIRPGSLAPREARLHVWDGFATGMRRLSVQDETASFTPDLAVVGETIGVLTRNAALFAPLVARTDANTIRVDPPGRISARVLESPDAIVIVATNAGDTTRRAKLTFPPDIPEAIWQNMEAGNAVNFVVGPAGPSYEHTFAPYDALVLAIRKKLR